MKTIVLAFSTSEWFSSAFLRWAQRCEYSHVEVVFNAGTDDEYAIGARTKGVNKYTDFSHLINRKFRTIEVSDEQYRKFYDFLHNRIGEKYDWRAYLGFALFKNTHVKDAWFCSEIVQSAFQYAGIEVLENAPAYWCMPRDFWISGALGKPIPAGEYVPS